MVELFFVYGLAFFILGASLFLRQAPESAAVLRPGLAFLGAFGLIHGVNEWLIMARLTNGVSFGPLETPLAIAIVAGISFIALFGAGLRLIAIPAPHIARYQTPLLIAAIIGWTAGLVGVIAGAWAVPVLDAFTRWTIGGPGGLLAGWALVRIGQGAVDFGRTSNEFQTELRRLSFTVAGVALLLYAGSTFFGPPLDILPASVINANAFANAAGFPVQVLRTVLAIIMMSAILAVLRGFYLLERQALETAVQDATRQLQDNEARLSESEARFRGVFENNLIASIIMDPQRRITGFNAAAAEMLGYAPDEALGHRVELIVPEPHRSRHAEIIERYLSTGKANVIGVAPLRVPALHKSGRSLMVKIDVAEFTTENGGRNFVATLVRADEED